MARSSEKKSEADPFGSFGCCFWLLVVAGWVRNRSDGMVESVVQGEPATVDAIVRWAHCGPQHAQVERVEIETDEGSYIGFEVIG